MKVNKASSADFIARGGQIPAQFIVLKYKNGPCEMFAQLLMLTEEVKVNLVVIAASFFKMI